MPVYPGAQTSRIALIDKQKAEEKAHVCAIAWLQHLSLNRD